MNLTVYKAFFSSKVIAKLLHEVFSGKLLQSITPGKHAFLHFYTLNVASVFLRIKKNTFLQVKRGVE